MRNVFKSFLIISLIFILSGCQTMPKPSIIPAIVPNSQKTEKVRKPVTNVIGAVEPIYLLPLKSAFEARLDTGATTSSIDADDIVEFERDGEKWVSFKVVNRRSGEEHLFEKPVLRSARIKRINAGEHRVFVMMDVEFGGQKFATVFSLAERDNFKYQVLIGRNILSGRYLVDVSVDHTLK